MAVPNTPYCGPAPAPDDWPGRWNAEPWLLAALAFGLGVSLWMLVRKAGIGSRHGCLLAGGAVLVIAFVSPLCALSSALFSARVTHDLLMITVAAPLLILSLPERLRERSVPARTMTLAFFLHGVATWLWHAPGPYAAALENSVVSWMMELSLLLTALLLWWHLLAPGQPLTQRLLVLLSSMMQMGLLGALITFARTLLYAPHFDVTQPFGLSSLEDQQLAGLIMWVPESLACLIAALLLLRQWLWRADIAIRMLSRR